MSLKNRPLVALTISICLYSSLVGSALAQSANNIFNDVNSSTTTYAPAIQYLKEKQIVQGHPDGSFAPESTINRAEFTKILIGATSTTSPTGSNCFPDVKQEWFAPYVCTAKKLNILGGYPDGTFKPAEAINFTEAAKVIANAFKLNKSNQDPAVWFKSYIEALQREKAIPLSVEYFDEKITRDEMAEIVWRIKADINDKSSRSYQELNGDELTQAKSCADLEERFQYVDLSGPIVMPLMEGAPTRATDAGNEKAGAGGETSDHSTTNIQVAGVDEADIVKNDGQYIYIITGQTIRIVRATPPNSMAEVVNFDLGPTDQNFYPSEMYINGNQLVVIGSAEVAYPMPVISTPTSAPVESKMIAPGYGGWGMSKTKIYIVDISDRAHPQIQRSIDFDGSYSTSRRIGDHLYLVLNQYHYFPYYTRGQTIPSFSEYLPKFSDSKNGGAAELIAPCDQIRLMPQPHSFNYLITAAIPLKDLSKDISRNVVVGQSQHVYASPSNLYIASSEWKGPYFYNQGSYTRLYKYQLANGNITYTAQGLVPGLGLNQFSMDEHNGNLRIATTQTEWVMGQNKTSNYLHILDGQLKTIGQITNIAPGERIYSTRFIGDRGYMVTFRNIDPLFVFDLSNPAKPVTLGELKIPGFSDYLHPYDATHLIGFGHDTDTVESTDLTRVPATTVKGMKIALFDVTNPAKPVEMFKEIIGDRGTYSDLFYNHKALLFDRAKNILAFPVSVTIPCAELNNCEVLSTGGQNDTTFVGAYVYGLDLQKGFQLKNKITHLSPSEEVALRNGTHHGFWEKTIQRILYIGDSLYTVSPSMVKANNLWGAMEELKTIDLGASVTHIIKK